jgi:ATP-binding cassette, subfamily C (CFTR/MRP), member 1
VAYASQQPFLLNQSIKENVLFGHELDTDFYNLVLEACALRDDLATMPKGDDTQARI